MAYFGDMRSAVDLDGRRGCSSHSDLNPYQGKADRLQPSPDAGGRAGVDAGVSRGRATRSETPRPAGMFGGKTAVFVWITAALQQRQRQRLWQQQR